MTKRMVDNLTHAVIAAEIIELLDAMVLIQIFNTGVAHWRQLSNGISRRIEYLFATLVVSCREHGC